MSSGSWFTIWPARRAARVPATVERRARRTFTLDPAVDFANGETLHADCRRRAGDRRGRQRPAGQHGRQLHRQLHAPSTSAAAVHADPGIQGTGPTPRSPATSRPQGVVVGDFEGSDRRCRASTCRTPTATATPPRRTASSSSRAARTRSTPATSCASPASPASASTRRRSTARTATRRPVDATSSTAARAASAPADVTLPFASADVPGALRGHAGHASRRRS